MRTNSATITTAHVARQVQKQGIVSERTLEEILREYGVNQEAEMYKRNLVAWRYLSTEFDPAEYEITPEGAAEATITLTVPYLNAKEIRRYLVEKLAGYAPLIDVGEVGK